MSDFPLLLLHGALGNKLQFTTLQQHLSDLKTYSLDFTGHGENSASPQEFNLQLFAYDVINFLEKHSIQKVNIFGHSMGGYVGLYLCLHHSDRINKLYTLGTKISWNNESAQRETGMLDAEKLEAKVPAFVEELKKKHPSADWKILLEKTKKMMMELGEKNPLNPSTLSSIKNKVRLGIGDRDTTAVVEDTVTAFRSLPNAQLEIFPNTQHPFERISIAHLQRSMEAFFAN